MTILSSFLLAGVLAMSGGQTGFGREFHIVQPRKPAPPGHTAPSPFPANLIKHIGPARLTSAQIASLGQLGGKTQVRSLTSALHLDARTLFVDGKGWLTVNRCYIEPKLNYIGLDLYSGSGVDLTFKRSPATPCIWWTSKSPCSRISR